MKLQSIAGHETVLVSNDSYLTVDHQTEDLCSAVVHDGLLLNTCLSTSTSDTPTQTPYSLYPYPIPHMNTQVHVCDIQIEPRARGGRGAARAAVFLRVAIKFVQ